MALSIQHRLTKPEHPQTNGMAERFNGHIAQVLNAQHFHSAEDLEQTLHRFVCLYNHRTSQKALHHEVAIQAFKRCKRSHPDLFSKQVRDRPGPET